MSYLAGIQANVLPLNYRSRLLEEWKVAENCKLRENPSPVATGVIDRVANSPLRMKNFVQMKVHVSAVNDKESVGT